MNNYRINTGYAKALFMLATDRGQADRVADDMRLVGGAMAANRELVAVFANPTVRYDKKLAIVRGLGAEYTINSAREDVHQRIAEITQGRGCDVVIEAVGAPATYQMAVAEVGFTGRVVCIGYAKQDVQFTTKLFVQKELDIRGSRNALPEDFEGVIRYLGKSNPPYDILISNCVKPEQAEEAMQQWAAAPAKVFRILVEF